MVLLVVVALLTACTVNFPTGTAPSPDSGTRLNSPASAARTSSPSPTIADCPATIRNSSGSYKFQCPAGWQYVNCESSDVTGAFTWLINPSGCRSAQNEARMMIWTVPGSVSAESGGSGMYVGKRQSSKNVVVDGITGTRRTYLVTTNVPIPKGTIQIVYTFVTGGTTHFAQYNRYPKEPDLTAAFDRTITTTLSFST